MEIEKTCENAVEFTTHDLERYSPNRIAELKIDEVTTDAFAKSHQQKYSEIVDESKGFRELNLNDTYPIDGCDGIFFHGKCKNQAEQMEEHIYVVRYIKRIYENPVQVTIKCYLGPFQSECQIIDFFRKFKIK
jgi:esterase/lipase superfamily enzyme